MTHTTRLSGTMRVLMLIAALLTALAIIPSAPADASVIRFVALDDTQPEFGAGARILTSVVPSTLNNDPIPGQVTEPYAGAKTGSQGALALAAIRALRWGQIPDSPLPAARTEVGAAVIGNTIWVVGGSSAGGTTYHDTVYRGTVNTNYGQPGAGVITWATSTPLPSVSHWDTAPYNNSLSARTNAAVAARRTGGNAGNLYVIGGAVAPGSTFSSNSVLVGDVDTNGNLTWRNPSSPYRLPATVGLEGARAFVHTTTAGKTFLYVVGGIKDQAGPTPPTMSNVVYYAEINADGSLSLGSNNRTWSQTSLPAGVSDTAVTVGRYTKDDGTVQDMFFIYGGRNNASNENLDTNTVLKGVINPTTGAITWEDSTTGGNAVLPANRNGHGAVEFNGSIYVIGGRTGGTINRNGYASYIDPTNLGLFKDGTLNFYQDDFGALPSSAAPGRRNPGVVLVPTSNPNYAFAYLIGGTDGSAPSSQVFRATIGPSDDQTFYPTTGYYYSKPFSMLDLVNEQQATVRKMTWLTNIDAANGGDIRLEYRVYSPSSGNCNDTEGGWSEVRDPDAGSGRFSKFNPSGAAYAINTQEYGEGQRLPPGNCFQYRATFTRGTAQNASPVLLRLGMEVIIPGNPDLNWPNNAVTTTQNADNTTRGVEVRLRNQNQINPPTQPANVCHASQPGCNPEGTFYVDVFIFPPGVTPIMPTLPLFAPGGNSLSNPALAPYHRACLQIPKWVMQKDVTFTIAETFRWSDIKTVGIDGCVSAATNARNNTGKILRDFFDQGSGTYKVILVADSHTDLKGLVYESDAADGNHPAELNNVSAIFDVPFVAGGAPPPDGPAPPPDEPPTRVFLPLVMR
ncbi:Kelch repeat-containing protein [Roseiflexus castenholzii]|uniref:Kelch repeat-containing protein n=1 Tax=Roseiflexus castenholzii (strain DSM 13941 / HLO8) TaxID=383372 RepID=A7NJV7_ROSCS|nr:kelch repeat-containing protein [Roseiflexus castenholzii]ABU57777.1 Kelch repeat-containing protein [Roseiflexus castenholzii DSM 13941]